ncbi:hypothetical protein CsatB_026072 [Cannabis sativa]
MQIPQRIHPISTPKHIEIITNSGTAVAVSGSWMCAFYHWLAPFLSGCKIRYSELDH